MKKNICLLIKKITFGKICLGWCNLWYLLNMGRVIKISESDIVKISKLIYESEIDLRQYDDEDFIEIFILNFRRWLIDNYGNETKNYPLSYVVNRYLSDYCKSIKDFDDDCLSSSRYYYSPKNEIL